jgi:predicted AlkP superfamily pyrophosphatase or phosphodiesterase
MPQTRNSVRIVSLSLLLLCAGVLPVAHSAPPPDAGLLLVSIDGLNPNYVTRAGDYGLKIPNLRRILRDGSHAGSVRGVLPTVTYPTHTAMLTGVLPAKHGIDSNTTFDPERKNLGGWYWYAEDMRSPTLWEAAAKAGYVVGSVAWPVSVGAPGVRFLIPEYWRAMKTGDDLKLLRALSSPGLLSELEAVHGKYIIDLDDAVPGDWMRTRYAASIIKEKRATIMTIHIASLDHIEHDTGPGSAAAFAALEEIDKMVGVLEDAIKSLARNAAVCIVSDHGMARVDHELNLNAAFVKAGLITPAAPGAGPRVPAISAWKAQPWASGGSAAIVLNDDADQQTLKKVERLLREMAADPANGIAAILDRKAIAEMGGSPRASFWVDLKPGFVIGPAMSGPVVKAVPVRGTHGYSPVHPEMRAAWFMSGPGIRKALDVGDIEIRSIAPTLARHLAIDFPSADLKPLPVFADVNDPRPR